MKKILSVIFFLCFSHVAFATNYFASSSGGGSASCVDNSANVCTLARAITVAGTGTNTIILTAGSYNITFNHWIFNSANTGANLTIQPATSAAVTLSTTNDSTEVFEIQPSMLSGSINITGITFNGSGNGGTALNYAVENESPNVNLTLSNNTMQGSFATTTAVYCPLDTTNNINLSTGNNANIGLRTAALTNVQLAQSFTVGGSNISINTASMHLQRIGYSYGPATNNTGSSSGLGWNWATQDTVTAVIETDSAGSPSGTVVTNGTSNTILAFNIAPNQPEWTFFTFSTPVTLTAGTKYWLVLQGSYTASSQFYIQSDTNTSSPSIGSMATYNGTIWTPVSGTAMLMTVDNTHNRNLTLTGNAMNQYGIFSAWSNIVNISSNTNMGNLSFTINGQQTTAGMSYQKIIVANNVANSSSGEWLQIGTSTFAKTYAGSLIVTGNTGSVFSFIQAQYYLKKAFIFGNTITITSNGNVPFQLGIEVGGSYPEVQAYDGFDQTIVESNSFTYNSTSHNHLFLMGIGTENGVFINNTISAPNGLGSGGGVYGLVLKADHWNVIGNKIYGPAATIYALSPGDIILYNTVEAYASGASPQSALTLFPHQDSIYGSSHGIPTFQFIENNIIINNGTSIAMAQCDNDNNCNSGTSGQAAPSEGFGRTEDYWSNRIDYNIYYSRNNTQMEGIGQGTNIAYGTSGNLSSILSAWQNILYSQLNSISSQNDLHSYIVSPTGINGSTGMFIPTGSYATDKASITGTTIGGYPSGSATGSSGAGGGSKMGISI